MGKRCKMCGGEGEHVYDMNSYHILQSKVMKNFSIMLSQQIEALFFLVPNKE
jgi:hypothetical protein